MNTTIHIGQNVDRRWWVQLHIRRLGCLWIDRTYASEAGARRAARRIGKRLGLAIGPKFKWKTRTP